MKLAVKDLTAPALDWAAAWAAGVTRSTDAYKNFATKVDPWQSITDLDGFYPTQFWSQAGRFIDLAEINLVKVGVKQWRASTSSVVMVDGESSQCEQYANDAKEAVVRCFVTSVLGWEIEVPDELLD